MAVVIPTDGEPMDPHVRWLRRLVLSCVATQLVIEGVLVGLVVALLAMRASVDGPMVVVLAVVLGQGFAVARLVAGLLFNPVNHRFLMGWLSKRDGAADQLAPAPHGPGREPDTLDTQTDIETGLDRGIGDILARLDFEPVVRLADRLDPIDAGTDGDGSHGEDPDHPAGDHYDVYASPCRLIIALEGPGQPLVVLSTLSDSRLLVTATETVPPNVGLVANLSEAEGPNELILDHLDRLDLLRDRSLVAVGSGPESVVDFLRLEWDSWNQLGPFIGPFLAIDARPQPHLLQVRIPGQALWDRTAGSPVDRVVHYRFRSPAIAHVEEPKAGPDVLVEVPRAPRASATVPRLAGAANPATPTG